MLQFQIQVTTKRKIFDINGGLVNEFGTLGSGDGEFNLTKGIEILNSEIFVVDSGNNRIQKINFDSSIFSDDYSSSIQWSQVGNTVTVDDALSLGKANFTQTPSVENAVMEGVFRNIGTTLSENNWRASFELTIGEIFANSTAFVWLMANGTSHPSDNNVNLDSLGVYLNQTSLSISKLI